MSLLRRIPINPDLPDQSFAVALLDGVYRFRVYWMSRLESWFLSLYNAAGVPLIQGLRLCVNSDLLTPYHAHDGLPPSLLFVVDLGNNKADAPQSTADEPSRLEIGKRFRLLYVDDRLPQTPGGASAPTSPQSFLFLPPGGSGGPPMVTG